MKFVSLGLLLLLLLLSRYYLNQTKLWNDERDMYALNDSMLQKKVLEIRDSSLRQIVEYNVVAINSNQFASSLSAENSQLKKDLSLVKGKLSKVLNSTTVSSVTRDTVTIPVDRFVSVKDTGIKKIPFSSERDTFLKVDGVSTFRVEDTGVRYINTSIDVSIRNSVTMTYFNRSKFLGPNKLQLIISQDNIHTTTGRVQTYYITPPRKFHQKWWVQVAFGVALGLGTRIL